MTTRVYCFTFTPGPKIADIEVTLELAILAAACLHGSPAVRVHAGYAQDRRARSFVLDGSTAAGRDVILLFAGFCVNEFGSDSFTVDRVSAPARRAG